MEGISDIRIVGIDETRPPRIRKEPYIDIYFALSHQAPEEWCVEFNSLLTDELGKPNIQEKDGLYIEAWVRKPEEIVALLDMLKAKVAECTQQYIERIESAVRDASADDVSVASEDEGEQGQLNRIIAGLDFDEGPTAA
jgi:hypothetical protein